MSVVKGRYIYIPITYTYNIYNIYNIYKVYINPPALIEASCNINIEDFPFDEQDCSLYFAR